MNKRLFVAGLPFSTTQDELSTLFATCGKVVSATIISDRESGKSKGFGFIEMQTPEEAQNAIQKLNNTEFGGRKLVVNEARPMEEKQRPSHDGNFQRGGRSRSFGNKGHQRRGNFGGNRKRY